MTRRGSRYIHGPIELVMTCDCGNELTISDEYHSKCPQCGNIWTVHVSLVEVKD